MIQRIRLIPVMKVHKLDNKKERVKKSQENLAVWNELGVYSVYRARVWQVECSVLSYMRIASMEKLTNLLNLN